MSNRFARPGKIRNSQKQRLLIDPLERRLLMSTITWVNRGQTSDGFTSVFGTNATLARSVVDADIQTWEREIINFNYPDGSDTYNITISMATTGTGTGASTTVTARASDGKPTAAYITIGRGTDGSGGGYFLDPTPLDSSEFTSYTTNAFAAYAGPTSAAYNEGDLYEIVLHEMGHAMGFNGDGDEASLVTNTNVKDTVDSNIGGVSPAVGEYYRFDSGSEHFLLTSFDSGGAPNSANDHGSPDHFADTGASYTYGGITYLGEDDLMTPYYYYGQRRLISQDDLDVLQSSFGYSVQTATYYGTEYDTLDSSGELRIKVPNNGTNSITLYLYGGNLNVSMTLGNPVPGTDPVNLSSVFSASAVTSVDIVGGPGNDSISVDGLGSTVPVTVIGNGGTDTLTVTNVGSTADIYGASIFGSNTDFQQIAGITNLIIDDGSSGSAVTILGVPGSGTTVNGGAGNDTLTYGQGDLTASAIVAYSGGGGTNSVVVDNRNSTGDWIYGLSDGLLTSYGPSSFGRSDTYTSVTGYTILSGSGDDTFTTSTFSTADVVSLQGGAGNDSFYLYNPVGIYTLSGGPGTNPVQVTDDYFGAKSNYTYAFNSSGFSRSGLAVSLSLDSSLTLTTSDGINTVNIPTLPLAPVTINAGTGSDAVNLGTLGSFPPYQGLAINGFSSQNVNLTLNSSGFNAANLSILTANTFNSSEGTLTYTNVSTLTYDLGSGRNEIYVDGTDPSTTYTINGDYASIVYLGNGDISAVSTNQVSNINALHINNAAQVYVEDQNGTTSRTYTLSLQSITIAGLLQVDLYPSAPVQVDAGSGNDSINIASTSLASPVTVNTGLGNDAVTVGNSSQDLLYSLSSNVTVSGGGGTDSLNVLDPETDTSGVPGVVTSSYVGVLLGGSDLLSTTTYSGFASLAFSYGTSTSTGESVDVQSTASNTPVTLNLGPSFLAVNVFTSDPTAPVTILPNNGLDAITVGPNNSTGTAVVDFAATQAIGSLTLNASGTAVVTPGVRKVLTVSTLTFGGNGTLDLTSNDLILHNGSLPAVTSEVKSGFNPAGGGKFNGSGIISSTAPSNSLHTTTLGAILNNNGSGHAIYGSLDGATAVVTDVLVKYTYFGDGNISGIVDGSDYSLIDNGYISTKTGTPLTGWFNGDFNYDGVVNGSDYTLIDNTYNQQGASLAAQIAAKPTARLAAVFADSPAFSSSAWAATSSTAVSEIFAGPQTASPWSMPDSRGSRADLLYSLANSKQDRSE